VDKGYSSFSTRELSIIGGGDGAFNASGRGWVIKGEMLVRVQLCYNHMAQEWIAGCTDHEEGACSGYEVATSRVAGADKNN